MSQRNQYEQSYISKTLKLIYVNVMRVQINGCKAQRKTKTEKFNGWVIRNVFGGDIFNRNDDAIAMTPFPTLSKKKIV